MTIATLQPGDIFLLNSGGWLNRTINFFQSLYSQDHKSDYIHAGIILDTNGQTFETTWPNTCMMGSGMLPQNIL